ncbi:MAG: DUF2812 domain-containing protein [Eubacteriales bacterium]|nr:DUF2812 domain-containing protein [Eubacteriales bacterium]
MSRIKICHDAYAAWDYEKEVEDLNKKSEEGWQLIHGGCFHSKFEENPAVRYRYQLDFQLHVENKMRYRELFKEQGWEYINSSFNGWHFFRKPYNPELPEEEYEIYMDKISKTEIAQRWFRMYAPLEAVLLIVFLICTVRLIIAPELLRLGILIETAGVLALGSKGLIDSFRVIKGGESRGAKTNITRYILVVLLGFAILTAASFGRASGIAVSWENAAFENSGEWFGEVEVVIPDFYYVDADCSSEIPMHVILMDEEGEPLFEKAGESFTIKNRRVFLQKGVYTLVCRTDEENIQNKTVNLKVNIS